MSQADLASLGQGQVRFGLQGLRLPAHLLFALLCYFLGGLLLVSQARLAVLRGRWVNQDLDIAPALLRRWHVNSLLAVLGMGLVATLLPMGTTSWLASALMAVAALLMRFIFLVLFLLVALLALLLAPFRFLAQSAPPAPQPVTSFEIPTQAEAVSRLPDWLGGAVLWTLVGAIVLYFALSYL